MRAERRAFDGGRLRDSEVADEIERVEEGGDEIEQRAEPHPPGHKEIVRHRDLRAIAQARVLRPEDRARAQVRGHGVTRLEGLVGRVAQIVGGVDEAGRTADEELDDGLEPCFFPLGLFRPLARLQEPRDQRKLEEPRTRQEGREIGVALREALHVAQAGGIAVRQLDFLGQHVLAGRERGLEVVGEEIEAGMRIGAEHEGLLLAWDPTLSARAPLPGTNLIRARPHNAKASPPARNRGNRARAPAGPC